MKLFLEHKFCVVNKENKWWKKDRNRVKIVKSAPPLECLNETYETKKTNSKKKITINKKYVSKNTQEMAIIFNSYSILS